MMQTILSGSMRLVSGLDTSGGTRLQMEFRYTSSFKCSLRMSEVTHVGIDISRMKDQTKQLAEMPACN